MIRIGPYCVVGREVELGPDTVLVARVTITGRVRVGARCVFHPTACIGGPPQDRAPAAPDGRIEIGDDTSFDEATTVHLPKTGGGVTRIGSRCRFRYGAHAGHDATVGDGVELGRFVALGGHSVVEDGVTMDDRSAVHQFATVGRGSRVRSFVPVTEDVPPWMEVAGNHYRVVGLAPGAPPELEEARRRIWNSGLPLEEALAALPDTPAIRELASFLRRRAAGRFGRALEAARK
jgi:UDP-N-acetylglucosamine acyltransferase